MPEANYDQIDSSQAQIDAVKGQSPDVQSALQQYEQTIHKNVDDFQNLDQTLNLSSSAAKEHLNRGKQQVNALLLRIAARGQWMLEHPTDKANPPSTEKISDPKAQKTPDKKPTPENKDNLLDLSNSLSSTLSDYKSQLIPISEVCQARNSAFSSMTNAWTLEALDANNAPNITPGLLTAYTEAMFGKDGTGGLSAVLKLLKTNSTLPKEFIAETNINFNEAVLKRLMARKIEAEQQKLINDNFEKYGKFVQILHNKPAGQKKPQFGDPIEIKFTAECTKEKQQEILLALTGVKLAVAEQLEEAIPPKGTEKYWNAQKLFNSGDFLAAKDLLQDFIKEDLVGLKNAAKTPQLKAQADSYGKRAQDLIKQIDSVIGDQKDFFEAQKLLNGGEIIPAKLLLKKFLKEHGKEATKGAESKPNFIGTAKELLKKIALVQVQEARKNFEADEKTGTPALHKEPPEKTDRYVKDTVDPEGKGRTHEQIDNPDYARWHKYVDALAEIERQIKSGEVDDFTDGYNRIQAGKWKDHVAGPLDKNDAFNVLQDQLVLDKGPEGVLELAKKYREKGKLFGDNKYLAVAEEYFKQYFGKTLDKNQVPVETLLKKYEASPQFQSDVTEKFHSLEAQFHDEYIQLSFQNPAWARTTTWETFKFNCRHNLEKQACQKLVYGETLRNQNALFQNKPDAVGGPANQAAWGEFMNMKGMHGQGKSWEGVALSDAQLSTLVKELPIDIAMIAASAALASATGGAASGLILGNVGKSSIVSIGRSGVARQVLAKAVGLALEVETFTISHSVLNSLRTGELSIADPAKFREELLGNLVTMGALGVVGKASKALELGSLSSFATEMTTMGTLNGGHLGINDFAMVLGLKIGHAIPEGGKKLAELHDKKAKKSAATEAGKTLESAQAKLAEATKGIDPKAIESAQAELTKAEAAKRAADAAVPQTLTPEQAKSAETMRQANAAIEQFDLATAKAERITTLIDSQLKAEASTKAEKAAKDAQDSLKSLERQKEDLHGAENPALDARIKEAGKELQKAKKELGIATEASSIAKDKTLNRKENIKEAKSLEAMREEQKKNKETGASDPALDAKIKAINDANQSKIDALPTPELRKLAKERNVFELFPENPNRMLDYMAKQVTLDHANALDALGKGQAKGAVALMNDYRQIIEQQIAKEPAGSAKKAQLEKALYAFAEGTNQGALRRELVKDHEAIVDRIIGKEPIDKTSLLAEINKVSDPAAREKLKTLLDSELARRVAADEVIIALPADVQTNYNKLNEATSEYRKAMKEFDQIINPELEMQIVKRTTWGVEGVPKISGDLVTKTASGEYVVNPTAKAELKARVENAFDKLGLDPTEKKWLDAHQSQLLENLAQLAKESPGRLSAAEQIQYVVSCSETLLFQMKQSYQRQLGEHGLRHLTSNVNYALRDYALSNIANKIVAKPDGTTMVVYETKPGVWVEAGEAIKSLPAEVRLMITTTMLYHDLGYATVGGHELQSKGNPFLATNAHPTTSASILATDPVMRKMFGENFEKMLTGMNSHDQLTTMTDNFQIDLAGGGKLNVSKYFRAIQSADNLATAALDKLPPIARRSSELRFMLQQMSMLADSYKTSADAAADYANPKKNLAVAAELKAKGYPDKINLKTNFAELEAKLAADTTLDPAVKAQYEKNMLEVKKYKGFFDKRMTEVRADLDKMVADKKMSPEERANAEVALKEYNTYDGLPKFMHAPTAMTAIVALEPRIDPVTGKMVYSFAVSPTFKMLADVVGTDIATAQMKKPFADYTEKQVVNESRKMGVESLDKITVDQTITIAKEMGVTEAVARKIFENAQREAKANKKAEAIREGLSKAYIEKLDFAKLIKGEEVSGFWDPSNGGTDGTIKVEIKQSAELFKSKQFNKMLPYLSFEGKSITDGKYPSTPQEYKALYKNLQTGIAELTTGSPEKLGPLYRNEQMIEMLRGAQSAVEAKYAMDLADKTLGVTESGQTLSKAAETLGNSSTIDHGKASLEELLRARRAPEANQLITEIRTLNSASSESDIMKVQNKVRSFIGKTVMETDTTGQAKRWLRHGTAA